MYVVSPENFARKVSSDSTVGSSSGKIASVLGLTSRFNAPGITSKVRTPINARTFFWLFYLVFYQSGSHFFYFEGLFLFLIALVLAAHGIEIEGEYGWEENLPTCIISNLIRYSLFSKRPLTGYHLTLVFLIGLFFHFPFLARNE
jgi:hypothetical protein